MIPTTKSFTDVPRSSLLRYAELSDREIVSRAQRGESQAAEFLLYKYRNLVKTKVKSYFLVGAEKDDLLQVGMIGLWQAVVDFRCDKAISFPAFAKVCIQRHIITAIKTATRQKQQPLNTSLSLESPSEDPTADWNLSDILTCDESLDPEELVLRSEDTRRFTTRSSRCSRTSSGAYSRGIGWVSPIARSRRSSAARRNPSITRSRALSARSRGFRSATPTSPSFCRL